MKTNKNNMNYKKKVTILKITKQIVINNGWSNNILKQLLIKGIEESDLILFFENDYKELLKFSLSELNKSLSDEIKKINIINFPTNKRIKKILMFRMKILNDDIKFYKKTFNHLLLPQNANIMKKSLYNAVDEMWYLAGDNSTDFNFYTKRAILSGIYVNALFVLFNKDFKQVEINIDKNLKKISKIPKFKERFSFIKDNIPAILKGLLS